MLMSEEKPLEMGLGDAIGRLNTLQSIIHTGTATEEIRSEYRMILRALNVIKLHLGFDCNNDGIPDTVEIFKESIGTGCCRLVDLPNVPDRSAMVSSRIKMKPSRG
jgi:hypothetical protein